MSEIESPSDPQDQSALLETSQPSSSSTIETQPDAGSAASPGQEEQKQTSKEGRKGRNNQHRLVGFRMESSCMVYQIKSRIANLSSGDAILLENRAGEVIPGRVTHVAPWDPQNKNNLFCGPVTRIIRRMTDQDKQVQETREQREKSAYRLCRQLIREQQLPMKLSKVSIQGSNKAIFHFTAENRVDFRALVKQLSGELSMRVEMRQLGVRDEAKLLGGMAPCGRNLCCSSHLNKFHPVSVRMAKNQDLSLNPDSISGVCGRLMCCLSYENDVYSDMRKGLPKPKSRMMLANGEEVAIRVVHPISQSVEIQFSDRTRKTLTVEELNHEVEGTTPEPKVEEPVIHQVVAEAIAQPNDKPTPKTQEERGENEEEKSGRKRRRRRRNKDRQEANQTAGEKPASQSVTPAPAEENAEKSASGEEPKKRRRRRRRKPNSAEAENKTTQQPQQASPSSPPAPAGDQEKGSGEAPKRRRRRRRRRGGNGNSETKSES
ncbi:PSP1 domain-containing protein [Magnetococcus sp. PR-3]|uniref:PSP1 domain-containing protein n=1 Tax=Magnetococcus sp. PR-3 TaxID=3120355 RepID=UPI002FCE4753